MTVSLVNAASIDINYATEPLKVLTQQKDADKQGETDSNGTIGVEDSVYRLQTLSRIWYQDSDNDGYTDGIMQESRVKPPGFVDAASLVSMDEDCNDNNKDIHPGAPEICNDGIDQDCNNSDCKTLDRFAGKYSGNFIGTSYGTWQLTVDEEGVLFGRAYDQVWREWEAVTGTVSSAGGLAFTTGFTSSGVAFEGSIKEATGSIQGTWKNPDENESGTFTGNGQFMAPLGTYDSYKGLYQGSYSGGGQYGQFYAGVDAFGNISILLDEGEMGNSTISSNGSFTVYVQTLDGSITISGTAYSSSRISGNWTMTAYGISGTFLGSLFTP